MDVGTIVKFKDGLYADEEGAIYKVIEDNGDRVFLEFICDLRFPPQSHLKKQKTVVIIFYQISKINFR